MISNLEYDMTFNLVTGEITDRSVYTGKTGWDRTMNDGTDTYTLEYLK